MSEFFHNNSIKYTIVVANPTKAINLSVSSTHPVTRKAQNIFIASLKLQLYALGTFFWSCTVAVMVQMFGDIACHCVSGLLREYVFHLFILTPSLCVLRSWNVVMQHYTISLCRLNQLLNTSGHLTQLTILCRTTCVSASEWKIKWVQRDNYTNPMGSFDALKRNCKNRMISSQPRPHLFSITCERREDLEGVTIIPLLGVPVLSSSDLSTNLLSKRLDRRVVCSHHSWNILWRRLISLDGSYMEDILLTYNRRTKSNNVYCKKKYKWNIRTRPNIANLYSFFFCV